MSGYQLADEPAPGHLARFAVNPLFPFLAIMLGGLWISWPWFIFNGIAVGSPTFRREIAWLAGGLVVVALIPAAIFALADMGILTGIGVSYAALSMPVAKLAPTYAAYVLQARTIEIYEYYGGVLKNGIYVVILLLLLRPDRLLEELPVYLQFMLQ